MNDKIKNEIVESKCITDENGNYFFGYYDVQPWNKDGNLHLCHKVDFWQRMPKQGEIAEIGIIDVNNIQSWRKRLRGIFSKVRYYGGIPQRRTMK